MPAAPIEKIAMLRLDRDLYECALVAADQGVSAANTGRLRLIFHDELSRPSVSRLATALRLCTTAGRRQCIVFAHQLGALTDVDNTAAADPAFDHASLRICRPFRHAAFTGAVCGFSAKPILTRCSRF